MSISLRSVQWKFLFTWIIANTIGTTTGALLFFIVFVVMQVNANAARNVAAAVLGIAVSGATYGAAVGVCQWTVLRRQIFSSKGWVLATIAGMAIGTALPASVAVAIGMSSDRWDLYVLTGLGTAWITCSIAQGLVLQQYGTHAIKWILASIVAGAVWGIGTVVGLSLFSIFLEAEPDIVGRFASAMLLVLASLILGGGITGSVLLGLLKNARNRS